MICWGASLGRVFRGRSEAAKPFLSLMPPATNRREGFLRPEKQVVPDRALGVPVKQHFEYQPKKTGSQNDRDDVQLPFNHGYKSGQADDYREPINDVRRGEDDMDPEPDGEV